MSSLDWPTIVLGRLQSRDVYPYVAGLNMEAFKLHRHLLRSCRKDSHRVATERRFMFEEQMSTVGLDSSGTSQIASQA